MIPAPHGDNIETLSHKDVNIILDGLPLCVCILCQEDLHQLRCGDGMLFIRVFVQVFKETERPLFIADRSHLAIPP